MTPRLATLASLVLGASAPLAAQGYRVRLDTHFQTAAFRGIQADSILAADAVVSPSGGTESADGFAVTCGFNGYCRFFRPGPRLHASPLVQQADVTAWGFGVPGLSMRANARALTDLTAGNAWPETEPALQLLEGYAEYAVAAVTARAGRQMFTTRLGPTGFDGGRVLLRSARLHLDGEVFGGWGLARATALPYSFDNPDFTARSLRGTAVLRWEYRPGSTIYFVWTQQRSGSADFGNFDFGRDYRALFRDRPDNVFLIKATYWLGR